MLNVFRSLICSRDDDYPIWEIVNTFWVIAAHLADSFNDVFDSIEKELHKDRSLPRCGGPVRRSAAPGFAEMKNGLFHAAPLFYQLNRLGTGSVLFGQVIPYLMSAVGILFPAGFVEHDFLDHALFDQVLDGRNFFFIGGHGGMPVVFGSACQGSFEIIGQRVLFLHVDQNVAGCVVAFHAADPVGGPLRAN